MQAPHSDLPTITADILDRLRQRRPRVHCITNAVAQNFTANMLLAAGAVPSMTIAPKEVRAFVARADALLVNLGTFDAERQKASLLAVAVANKGGIPWVLDPVFIDRSKPRAAFAKTLVAKKPRALRLNRAEFEALAGAANSASPLPWGEVGSRSDPGEGLRPIESPSAPHPNPLPTLGRLRPSSRAMGEREHTAVAVAASNQFDQALAEYAKARRVVVGLTGERDLVRDQSRIATIANGHPLMARVTAMGCAASALVAACLAVEPDAWRATSAALILFGVAGEIAAARARGPGSFAVEILDSVHGLDRGALMLKAKVN